MWIDVIKNVNNPGEGVFKDIASHHVPVIIYGLGIGSAFVCEQLELHGIEVSAFATDEKPLLVGRKFLGKPVVAFSKIKAATQQQVFVWGWPGGMDEVADRFLNDPTIIKYYLVVDDEKRRHQMYDYHEPISYAFIQTHYEELDRTYHWLSDDLSRQTFCAYLNLKISGDIVYNFDVFHKKPYFNRITASFRSGVFVDCGAYNGDSIEQYVQWCDGKYKKIYAFEPDEKNRQQLFARIHAKQYRNVKVFPYATWDKAAILKFHGGGTTSSAVEPNGLLEIRAEAMDALLGNEKSDVPFFIKMDIEGSEFRALEGAYHTLATHLPALAICVYHRADDLITIPQYIKSFETAEIRYHFYLRKHEIASCSDLVLYAIPHMAE